MKNKHLQNTKACGPVSLSGPAFAESRVGDSAAGLASLLTAWYHKAKRDLPWRDTTDPYTILVSELMLQQTQVGTVIPYFQRFMARFPTVQALAAADLQEVLRLWAGLGYYRRARHLHNAAKYVVTSYNGVFPSTVAGLLELPGVGRYTAGAVASIAFGQAEPVVDGNVMRVLARVTNLDANISLTQTKRNLWELAARHVPAAAPGDYNQALMELGATVCRPRNPQCPLCPVGRICGAFAHGTQNVLPIKSAKAKPATVHRRVFVLRHQDRVLLVQRPKGCTWEELWEFPAWPGAKAPGRAEITRELGAGLGLQVTLVRRAGRVEHQLTHRSLAYEVYCGQVTGPVATVRLPPCESGTYVAHRWVRPGALDHLPVARMTHKIAAVALAQE